MHRIITNMDGIPVINQNKEIAQYLTTKSCRDNAKNLTFKNKIRHHSRWLTKDQFYRAQQEYQKWWSISMATLWRKWDHN